MKALEEYFPVVFILFSTLFKRKLFVLFFFYTCVVVNDTTMAQVDDNGVRTRDTQFVTCCVSEVLQLKERAFLEYFVLLLLRMNILTSA